MRIFIDNTVIGYESYFSKENLDKSIKIFLFSADDLQKIITGQKLEFRLSNKDVFIIRSKVKFKKGRAINLPGFIGSCVSGSDHLDLDWLESKGVKVYCATGCNAESVRDYILAIILSFKIISFDMVNFKQKKAGVIGFGHVGKQVASLLKSIGFKVLIYDPFIDNNSFIRRGESKNNGDRIYNLTRSNNSKRIDSIEDEYIFVSNIDDILDCSFISIHCSLTKSSESLIDKDFISKLKSGTFLINASRGEVINESDLINYGEHINYCLDVWINEPKISKKLVASSIFATPHIAGHSKYAKLNGLDMVYKKLIEWMKKSIVNKYLLGENNISFRNKLNDLEKINDGTMGKIITLKQMDLLLKEGVNLDLYNNEHILSSLFQELRA